MNPSEALELARHELDKHGLVRWTPVLDRAVRRFGLCRYRTQEISLSRHLVELNDRSKVRHVILHEIAHALAGPGAKHGPVWKRQCLMLGIPADRCVEEAEVPQGRYVAVCGACGHEHYAHRMGRRMRSRELYCDCARRRGFNEETRLRWEHA